MKISKSTIKSIFYIIAYLLFVTVVWYWISSFLVDKEAVSTIVSSFGIFGPIIFMLIQIAQNIVAPIAHYPILLAGGLIFGPLMGFVYNWIGTVIGTYIIILLTKKYGRPLVKRMVNRKFIAKYDHLIKKLSPFGLFIIYFLPVFPDDEITYLIGLSNMSTRNIFLAIILGKTGGATLSIMGYDPINGAVPTIIINAIILGIGAIIYFWKNILNLFKIKRFTY